MKETKMERSIRFMSQMEARGFDYGETKALLRIERTLQRWGELECGNSNDRCSYGIERDDETGKPFMVTSYHDQPANKARRQAIPDREKNAIARLQKIMAKHPDYVAYHQGDCRGCNVYIVAKKDLDGDLSSIDRLYTRGLAVCV